MSRPLQKSPIRSLPGTSRLLLAFVFAVLATANVGCTWVGQLLGGVAVNAIDQQTLPEDGRDRDAAGLTESDKVARGEEAAQRSFKHNQQIQEWEEALKQEQQLKQQDFKRDWNKYLSRGQLQQFEDQNGNQD